MRDLGGLKIKDGRETVWRKVVRSDTPARLTASGWDALYAYGIRTIVSLRTVGLNEKELDFTCPFTDIKRENVAVEDITDQEFARLYANSESWCTPLYYRDALERWPERHAAVIKAIANANSGGVLFHCIRGQDRTGIISLMLLKLVGVTEKEMIADYALSIDPERDKILSREGVTLQDVILQTFGGLNIENYFRSSGVTPEEIHRVRKRML